MPTEPRAITSGPTCHWFGYYDKLQFSADARYVLGMEVAFENRTPTIDDRVRIGMVDLHDGDRWIDLCETNAFCWQQGCMLQWRPGHDDTVVYNDREDGELVSRILDVRTGERRTIPQPVYTLSPDGKTAMGLDFIRTGRLRPGYGYAGVDRTIGQKAPKGAGIYRIDLDAGNATMVISLEQVVGFDSPAYVGRDKENWVNHLLFSPDGSRFIFLHRHASGDGGLDRHTRMFTAAPDGSDMRLVTDGGMSHFIWRDASHIHGWGAPDRQTPEAHVLFSEKTGRAETVGNPDKLTHNGHMTYLPGAEWILNDQAHARKDGRHATYAYLYHVPTDSRINIADVWHDDSYRGEFRCDLHPRSSRDGSLVCFDSCHEQGRQLYLVDISDVTAS